jgi:hypothetical protein
MFLTYFESLEQFAIDHYQKSLFLVDLKKTLRQVSTFLMGMFRMYLRQRKEF